MLVHVAPMNAGISVTLDRFTIDPPIGAGIAGVCWKGSFVMLGTIIFAFPLGFGLGLVLGLADFTGEHSGLALALTSISDTAFSTSFSLLISMINYVLH